MTTIPTLNRKTANEAATIWWNFEKQIKDLTTRIDALKRLQKLHFNALTDWAATNQDPHTHTVLTGNAASGFVLGFRQVKSPIKWKDHLITRLTTEELAALQDQRTTKHELTITPRFHVEEPG